MGLVWETVTPENPGNSVTNLGSVFWTAGMAA